MAEKDPESQNIAPHAPLTKPLTIQRTCLSPLHLDLNSEKHKLALKKPQLTEKIRRRANKSSFLRFLSNTKHSKRNLETSRQKVKPI